MPTHMWAAQHPGWSRACTQAQPVGAGACAEREQTRGSPDFAGAPALKEAEGHLRSQHEADGDVLPKAQQQALGSASSRALS